MKTLCAWPPRYHSRPAAATDETARTGRRMTGKFNFTYTLGANTAPGTTATTRQPAAPALRPLDLFPTRIWQCDLEHVRPHLDRWVKRTLALRAASPNSAGRTQPPGLEQRGYDRPDIHLAPRPGLLVLFPYWLEHYVEPHESDELRITIAFNANP
jgi:hypothetical protein